MQAGLPTDQPQVPSGPCNANGSWWFQSAGMREIFPAMAVLVASLLFARSSIVPELAVAGVCLFWRPRLGGLLGVVLLGLGLVPLLAMLPASWFGEVPWRVSALGGEVPSTLTPQPWAFLSVWTSYLSGLVFLWWVCGRSAPKGEVRASNSHATEAGMRQFVVLLFASFVSAIMIFSRWDSGAWRGPMSGLFAALFDTRNQAASFAAIALCGSAIQSVGTREIKWKGIWFLAAGLCAAALLSLGSRGGVLAASAGCLTGWGILFARKKQGWRTGLAIVTVVVVGGVVVLRLPSVPLIDRFAADGASGLGYRLAVQADAWRMLASHPVSGVGLGSFDGVFPFFRSLSASIWRTVHPESDWLWFACEAGVFAGLLAVGAGVLLAGRWWKVAMANEPVPAAVGLGCLAALAVHGLLDVPAHSGPVWFLAANLAGVGLAGASLSPGRSRVVPIVVALCLGALAVAQLKWTPSVRPPEFSADRPLDLLPGRHSVDSWMKFRPLDVEIVEVAAHQTIRRGDRLRARELLARLFLLEPFSPLPATRAMGVLVERGDIDLAVLCAQAILARTPSDGRGERLRQILKQFSGSPGLSQPLLGIEPTTSSWQAARIEFLKIPVSRAEFELLIKLASRRDDPGLTESSACRAFFSALASGHSDVVEKAAAIPALRRAAHRARAESAASGGDPAGACLIVMKNLAPPIDEIDADYPVGADAYGLTMKALVEWRAGNIAKARVLLVAATPQKGAPPFAWYLLGCAEYQAGASERGWEAFEKFLSAGDQCGSPASDAGRCP